MKKKLLTVLLCAAMLTTSTVMAFAAEKDKGVGSYSVPVTGTYKSGSAAGSTISVDIIWDSMEFTYNAGSTGTWDAGSHSYDGTTKAGWSDNKVGITVKNHSDTAVTASFEFKANTDVKTTGTFYTKESESYTAVTGTASFELATAFGTTRDDNDESNDTTPKDTMYFGVSGDSISESVTLGDIVVTIAEKKSE